MPMKVQKKVRSGALGFSLVEVMIATVILSVAVIGASGYRYYAALDARKAAMRTTAARIALLLCENWRGVKGAETYDPTAYFGSDLTIATLTSFDESGYKEADFTLLGGYTVTANSTDYAAILSWKDIDTELRALNVVAVWPLQYGYLEQGHTYKLFKLTTYTAN